MNTLEKAASGGARLVKWGVHDTEFVQDVLAWAGHVEPTRAGKPYAEFRVDDVLAVDY